MIKQREGDREASFYYIIAVDIHFIHYAYMKCKYHIYWSELLDLDTVDKNKNKIGVKIKCNTPANKKKKKNCYNAMLLYFRVFVL